MIEGYIPKKRLNRREFLKESGKIVVSICAASVGIKHLTGCTPSLKETRAEVNNQEWEANPIITVPKDGCYTGLSTGLTSLLNYERNLELLNSTIKKYIDLYTNQVGKSLTIYAISASLVAQVFNENFPTNRCLASYTNGAIPMIKYIIKPFKTFNEITTGRFDEKIKEFARKAKEFEKPYFFIPFGESNLRTNSGAPFFGMPPNEFKEAYIHMHRIFQRVGANNNTVWVIQFETDPNTAREFGPFYPGDEYVDWIGFTVQNRTDAGHPYLDFSYRFRKYYNWARKEHPKKPVILVEIGKSNDMDQPKWIRKAYRTIKEEFPAIKAAICWEGILSRSDGRKYDDFRSLVNPESIKERREALRDPYFIGSIINK